MKSIATLIEDAANEHAPQSPIMNDSILDGENAEANEENLDIEESRHNYKVATYHILKAHNHHLATAHFHHAGLVGSPSKGGKSTPSSASSRRGKGKSSRKNGGGRSRTNSTESLMDENTNITFGGFRGSAGISEILGTQTSNKKKSRRSSTMKKRSTGGGKGHTFVTQLPPAGYRSGNTTPSTRSKKGSTRKINKRSTAYKHISTVKKKKTPMRRQSSHV